MIGPRFNPFQPDQPAPTSIFTGRVAELALVKQALVDTLRGHASHVLAVGERGMGKTSLARYVAEVAVSDPVLDAAGGVPAPAVLFVSLGYAPTVDEACAAILHEAYRWAKERSSPLVQWFQHELRHLEGLTIGPFGVNLKSRDARTPGTVPRAFPDAIGEFARQSRNGVVVLLDETEALSRDPLFPSFLKSTLETLTVRGVGSIALVVTMTPEGRDRCAEAHASFPRLFRHVTIGQLSKQEVGELVVKTLALGLPRKEAQPAFVEELAHISSGIPGFVHEIGRAAFEVDSDDVLDGNDLFKAIVGTDRVVGALAILEQKHFRERYTKQVLSNTYRTILHAVANAELELRTDEISTAEIRKRCPDVEQVTPYLSNMTKRGVLARVDGKKGVYRLPDRMFGVFLRMAHAQSQAKKTRAAS